MKRLVLCWMLLWGAGLSAPGAPRILYVNQYPPAGAPQTGESWANALPSLQEALRLITASNLQPAEIWVAKGTYYPSARAGLNVNRGSSFKIPSNVAIRGGFAGHETSPGERTGTNLTVLSGDIGQAMTNALSHTATSNQLAGDNYYPFSTDAPGTHCQDNSFNVITCLSPTNVVLESLTICGGYAGNLLMGGTNVITPLELENMGVAGRDANHPTTTPLTNIVAGGGILLRFADTNLSHPYEEIALTVTNCLFLDNYAAGYGGAICAFGGNLVVRNSQFRNNWSGVDGGAIWDASGHSAITGCRFEDNVSRESGGAVAYAAFNFRDTVNPAAPSYNQAMGWSSSTEGQCVLDIIKVTALVSGKLAFKIFVSDPNGGMLTILSKMAAGEAIVPLTDLATEGLASSVAGGASSMFTVGNVYMGLGMVMSAMEIGVNIAMLLGVSPDDPFVETWGQIYYWWNQITSPIQWLENLWDWLTGSGDADTQNYRIAQYRQSQLSNYNIQTPAVMDQCVFVDNSATLLGGAVAVTYKNVLVQRSWFANNAAVCGGGAVACSTWGVFKFASCVFYGNSSISGHSVAHNFGSARAYYINCTMAHNASGSTNGFAIGNDMGANVKLFNSILWDNINSQRYDGGADVYTVTSGMLTGRARDLYDQAQTEARGEYVATCDIKHCDIQSLNQLPGGQAIYPGYTEPFNEDGDEYVSDEIWYILSRYEWNGQAEENGWVNVAEGNMLSDRFGGYRNVCVDPCFGGLQGVESAIGSSNPDIYWVWIEFLTLHTGRDDDIFGTRYGGNIKGAVSSSSWPPRPNPPVPACSGPPRNVPPSSGVIYVDLRARGDGSGRDWSNGATNLAAVLQAGLPAGVQVWVAEGTYPAPPHGFSVADRGRVFGGFGGTEILPSERVAGAHPTYLAGSLPLQDRRILTLLGDTATVDGFYFLHGAAEAGTPGGGAIYGARTNGNYTISNCAFTSNTAVRTNGQGGAVCLAGSARILNCSFTGNQASQQGGALCLGGGGSVFSSLFWGNSAGNAGGAVFAGGADVTLGHDTFYGNTVTGPESAGGKLGGAGMYFNDAQGGNLAVRNCIFWNNTAPYSSGSLEWRQLAVVPWTRYAGTNGQHHLSVSGSLIQGMFAYTTAQPSGYPDEANYIHYPALYDPLSGLDADPLFVNPAGGNFQLQAFSPAIGVGTANLPAGFPDTDLAGNARSNPNRPGGVGAFDLGAYQFQGVPTPATVTVAVQRWCGDYPPSFTVEASWATNARPASFAWQVWSNQAWVTISGTNAIYQTIRSNYLGVVRPPPSFSGNLYRLTATGAPGFTSRSYAQLVIPPVLYVKAGASNGNGLSWATALGDPGQAMAAAAYQCQEIWVAGGTYSLSSSCAIKPGVSLYGGFNGTETSRAQRDWRANPTVIDGRGGRIFDSQWCDSATRLDGFTLTGGSPAISIGFGAPDIENCVFWSNGSAVEYRGGRDQTGRNFVSGPARVANCRFEHNGTSLKVGGANVSVIGCLFANNQAWTPAVSVGYDVLEVPGAVKLIQCTLADNGGNAYGGAWCDRGGTLEIVNSIVWNNSPAQVGNSGGSLTVSNSLVQGWEGAGILDAAPLFAQPGLDYHLTAQSPALGAGIPAAAAGMTADLDGLPRTRVGGPGSGLDLGAYQFQGAPENPVLLKRVPQSVSLCGRGAVVPFTLASTNDLSGAVWLVDQGGGGFVEATNPALFATEHRAEINHTSTLAVLSAHPGMNGWRFAARIGEFTSPAVELSVGTPAVFYVNAAARGANNGTSWADAYTRLEDGVAAVGGSCSELWVAEGTYTNTGGAYPRPNQGIYGGFAGVETAFEQRDWASHPTIVVGADSQPIFRIQNRNSATVVDGFILRGRHSRGAIANDTGAATIRNCAFDGCLGWAINNNHYSGLIANCIFTNGQDTAIWDWESAPFIRNCQFLNNHTRHYGAALYEMRSRPTVTDCIFSNNAADWSGGAIYGDRGGLTVDRCFFYGNTGGAIDFQGGEFACLIRNSLFRANNGWNGAAIEHFGSTLQVVNCTLVENQSRSRGGAIVHSGAGGLVANSILWGNTASAEYHLTLEQAQLLLWSGTLTVSNCLIQGLQSFGGQGNLGYDPLFVRSIGDYHLMDCSPALGAGNPGLLAAATTDLEGHPRTRSGGRGSGLDLGAYQFQGAPAEAVELYEAPQSVTFCSTAWAPTAVFSASLGMDLSGSAWLVKTNSGGFVPATDATLFQHSISEGPVNVTSLRMPAITPDMDGWQFVLQIGPYTTPAAVLTAQPPTVWYVDSRASGRGTGTSWSDAFTDLRPAMAAAGSCSQIWVAEGTYTNTDGWPYAPAVNQVILGGFAGGETNAAQRDWRQHATVLAGAGTVFQFGSYYVKCDAATVVDGFVLRGASMVNQSGSATIRNCVFDGCGRMAINNSDYRGTIAHCTFTNGQDSAIHNERSTPRIDRCTFVGNRAESGSALYDSNSASWVTDCVFSNNVGRWSGAIYSGYGWGITVERCLFQANYCSASEGGAMKLSGSPGMVYSIRNSAFIGNSSTWRGGAIHNNSGALRVVGCTFVGNWSVVGGAGIVHSGVNGLVANSIFWGNQASQADLHGVATEQVQILVLEGGLSVSNSCLQGLRTYAGRGNLGFDPLFAAAGSDYHLTASSSALGAGEPGFLGGDTTDMEGNARTRTGGRGTGLDLGAYQYQGTPAPAFTPFSTPPLVSACGGGDPIEFSVSATNDMTGASWLVNRGDGAFVRASDPSLFGSGIETGATNVARLAILAPTIEMNGWQFALWIGWYTNPPTTLTVTPAPVVYVNAAASGANNGTSWADAFTNLSTAIAAGGVCSQIWVAEGAYVNPGGTPYQPFHNQALYGGFAGGETNLSQRDWASHPAVLAGSAEQAIFRIASRGGVIDARTVVDGFVLRSPCSKGAIINQSGAAAIRNCAFDSCAGYGIYNRNYDGAIVNCVFTNGSDSAICNSNAMPRIAGCWFANNRGAQGAAIQDSGALPTVTDCVFSNNVAEAGGAIYSLEGGLNLDRCVFEGNRASRRDGGAVYIQSGASSAYDLKNSLFHANVCAGQGGAIRTIARTVRVVNCTLVENQSVTGGGGLAQKGEGGLLANSILWGNTAVQGAGYGLSARQAQLWLEGSVAWLSGGLEVKNCLIQGLEATFGQHDGFWAGGNSGLQPWFAVPGRDWRLTAHSPGLGAGVASALAGATADLGGNPRFRAGGAGSGLDVGAYQFQGSPAAQLSFFTVPEPQSLCLGGATVWFQASAPGTNDLSPLVWLVNAGGGFGPATNPAIFSSSLQTGASNTARLTVLAPTLAMNGWQVAFQIGSITSPPASLSVYAPTVLYVDAAARGAGNGASWADAFTDLVSALAAGGECSQIWVAQGTYANAGDAPYTPGRRQAVFGGFAGGETNLAQRDGRNHPTILTGGADAPIFWIASATELIDAATIVDGFILRGECAAGAIFNGPGTAATIANCVFEGSAGYAIQNTGYSGAITNCAFIDGRNSAICDTNSTPRISQCAFLNNRGGAYGGALRDQSSQPVVTDCLFSNNAAVAGGAISSQEGGLTVDRCVFQGNEALGGEGGGIYISSNTRLDYTIRNSLFEANLSGAIKNAGGALQVINCTLVRNAGPSAYLASGGIHHRGAAGSVVNSILWGNTCPGAGGAYQAQLQVAWGALAVSNCCIQGLGLNDGNGNWEADPLFANPGLDYRLTAHSPALGAGNASALAGAADLDGHARTRAGGPGSGLDAGAYQFQGTPAAPLVLKGAPQPVLACSSGDAVSFGASAGTDLSAAVWLVDMGTGEFVPATNTALFTSLLQTGALSTARLTLPETHPDMSGWQFSLRIGSDTTPPAGLIFAAQPVFLVDGSATGANNGTSWADAFTSLGAAMAAAGPCSQIWVAQGTYVNPGGASFVPHPRQGIYGGFAGGETSLSQRDWAAYPAVLIGGDGQPVFSIQQGSDPITASTIIDGFVLHSAYASGAVANQSGAATIRNCTFEGCAGWAVNNSQYSGTITNCVFANGQDSAIRNSGSTPRINGCSFVNNVAKNNGGAIQDVGSQPVVTDCVFSNNVAAFGGALYGYDSGLTLERCAFQANRSSVGEGGAIYSYTYNSSSRGLLDQELFVP